MPARTEPGLTRIGWIGTGVMGASMCGHLLDAGYDVVVTSRTRAKAQALVDRGATWAETPGAVAADRDVLFTMVGYPSEVEEVLLGDDGAVALLAPGSVVVDMTSSRPALAETIAEAAAQRGVHALDAPVSGGDVGARAGTLSIMLSALAIATMAETRLSSGESSRSSASTNERSIFTHCVGKRCAYAKDE